MKKTVVFFTSHVYRQKRRGGFHWLCDGFRALGWNTRFITVDYSLVSRLRKDRRDLHGEVIGLNRLERLEDDLEVGVLYTAIHPMGNGRDPLRLALSSVTGLYPGLAARHLSRFVAGADLIILESNASLFLAPNLRRISDAPLVYRVSDNLDVIRPVASQLEAERRAAKIVDRISLASDVLAQKFAGAPVSLDPMGLDKSLFDAPSPSPYPADGRPKVVCSGSALLDMDAVRRSSNLLPSHDFYYFGNAPHPHYSANIRWMGEFKFQDLVPYVQHADIGFAPYRTAPGFEYQAQHSNRLLQYVYCQLPSVLPRALCGGDRPGMFGYEPEDDASIAQAFTDARQFDHALVPKHEVLDWREVAQRLAAYASLRDHP